MSDNEICKFCNKEMKFTGGGRRLADDNNTYISSKCECGAEFTIEKIWTTEVTRALKKDVRNRTEKEHHLLIKHFGGARKYFLSVGKFKENDI